MVAMTFYERYAKCCHEKGIAPVSQFAADQLGCTKGTISAAAKNGTVPKGEIVAGAAKMLGVSVDYLLALTDNTHTIETNIPTDSTLAKAMAAFQLLNTKGQEAALAMLTGLSSQPVYQKDHPYDVVSKNE